MEGSVFSKMVEEEFQTIMKMLVDNK